MPIKQTVKTDSSVVEQMRRGNCNVYYEKSVTKNLGNYESAKITVGVVMPIEPTEEEKRLIANAFVEADELVTNEIEVQLKDLTKPTEE